MKIFVDGVIEAATAYVIEPYLPVKGDLPARPRGLPNFTDDALTALVTRLDREGFQTHMHAIGDAGIRQGLDAIAAAARTKGARDRRPHIAHIQLFHPTDIRRFGELGVVANMQPLWAYADDFITTLTEPRLGLECSKWLYPFRSLQQAGARLAGGSYWSVSSVNPLDAIEVAVTRSVPVEVRSLEGEKKATRHNRPGIRADNRMWPVVLVECFERDRHFAKNNGLVTPNRAGIGISSTTRCREA